MKPIGKQIKTVILNKLSKGHSTIIGKPATYVRRPGIWIPNFLNSHEILSQYINDEPLAKIQDNVHIQVINRGIKQLGRIIKTQQENEYSK